MAARNKSSAAKAEIQKQNEIKERRDRVMWSTLLFALGVLSLMFILISGESAWNSIHNILLGLFGISVLAVPAILIYVSVMIAKDRSEVYVSSKIFQCFMMILLFSGFVQIVFSGELQGEDLFGEVIPTLFAEGKKLRGGGVVSVIIAGPLLALFKKTGATIIIILLIFVFAMILANKTIIDVFRSMRNAVNKASAERAERYVETEDFVPPPGAKNKKVPNQDVPEKIAKEKQKNFNVDIPMPQGQKLDTNDQIKATGTVTEPPIEIQILQGKKPVSEPVKTADEVKAAVSEEKPAEKKPLSELESIIKKAAAAPKKALTAPKPPVETDEHAELKKNISNAIKQKQSTLASDKINTTEELDMPDAPTAADIQNEIAENKKEPFIYQFPPISLLKPANNELNSEDAEAEMKANADTLVETLSSFGVKTRIVDIHRGPTVTRYELQPNAGVKISKITSLSDDIALNLAAAGVRMEAPIPGKSAVGIEVPNRVKDTVSIREMIESDEFAEAKSKLSFVVGKNIDGDVIVGDIGKMPHVIIAGTTGSGKSVCTNSIIMSILYNASPDEVRLVLIDPKMVQGL